jgi:hypothetical protein
MYVVREFDAERVHASIFWLLVNFVGFVFTGQQKKGTAYLPCPFSSGVRKGGSYFFLKASNSFKILSSNSFG